MQELNIKNVEKTHELVLTKQKLSEFYQEYNDMKHHYEVKLSDYNYVNAKFTKDIKSLRKKIKLFELENSEYKDIFDGMKSYIDVIKKAQSVRFTN